jgi:D-3-phosphoglycerate dehydrogenase
MAEEGVVIAVIGGLFGEGAAEARERLERAGATLVRARGPGEDDIITSCADADIVMVLAQVPFTERVLTSLPRLAFLMQCTVGYDRVDVAAATRHGVAVANSPFFCMEEVSDHAAMLLWPALGSCPTRSTRSRAMAGTGWRP